MFFVRYLRSELTRRRTRTILTAGGFAVGVGLVVVIAGESRGLDDAQKTALNPLSSIGTDITVTLAAQQQQQSFGAAPGGGGAGGRELVEANQSVVTDLSKLGKPRRPLRPRLLPARHAADLPAEPGQPHRVAARRLRRDDRARPLRRPPGRRRAEDRRQAEGGRAALDIRRQITPPSAAEFQQMQACFQKAGVGQPQQGGGLGAGGFRGGGGGPGGAFDSAAARKCLPARLRQFRARITTPQQTLRQVLDPPQTNITSTTYTIGGVDPSQREIGLVTPSLVTKGRFCAPRTRRLWARATRSAKG
ncbi:MAG: hypothetical protein ABR583_01190 [Gaiellaceae bacterium]